MIEEIVQRMKELKDGGHDEERGATLFYQVILALLVLDREQAEAPDLSPSSPFSVEDLEARLRGLAEIPSMSRIHPASRKEFLRELASFCKLLRVLRKDSP